jgi:hypothetical protein
VKFTEKGFVKLDISLINGTNSNSKYVLLCLSQDWNLKENQKKIFKAFSQEDSSTKKFGYWFRPNNFKQITRTNGQPLAT